MTDRLEEIKRRKIALGAFGVPGPDVEWLIAEVERLRAERDDWEKMCGENAGRANEAKAEAAALRRALEQVRDKAGSNTIRKGDLDDPIPGGFGDIYKTVDEALRATDAGKALLEVVEAAKELLTCRDAVDVLPGYTPDTLWTTAPWTELRDALERAGLLK